MPKLPQVSGKDVVKTLAKIGFKKISGEKTRICRKCGKEIDTK